MRHHVASFVRVAVCAGLLTGLIAQPSPEQIALTSPMPAPAWALAERALIDANSAGVQAYAARFLDARGHLPVAPRWGVNDGPDDLMENIRNWPLAHAIGGADSVIETWQRAWEGHLDQFSQAKIPALDITKDGIYFKEFTPQFDWEHISEGLGPFYFYGLSRPADTRYQQRMRRFAGFYMNEDAEAANFDPRHKIIRSLFNGSKGPKLTPATVDDWDGPLQPGTDPNGPNRTRFATSHNIRGDHPLNLNVAMLHFHAYLLTGQDTYRDWLLDYVNAWRDRTEKNGGNIPSNIGLDGTIGGEWGGKWYGGVFGWNSPDTGVRNYVLRGPPEAFGAALLLTGDQRYTQVLRRQIDNLFAASKVEQGKRLLPRFFGEQGWYGFHEVGGGPSGSLGNLHNVLIDFYMWSLLPGDLARAPDNAWLKYLQSGDASYPLRAFQQGLDEVRRTAARFGGEAPQGRGSGGPPLAANPVATTALINLTMGANDPGGSTHGPLPLHAQVRHFDPDRRRAGLPADVAALVHGIQPGSVTLTLVNVNALQPRSVVVQMGAYGEHRATTVRVGERTTAVDAPSFTVRLAPGAGGTLEIGMRRYAYQPTLSFPWDRGAVSQTGQGRGPGAGRRADGSPPEIPIEPKAPAGVKEGEIYIPPMPSMEAVAPPPGWMTSGPDVPPMPLTLMRLPRTNITRAKYPAVDFHVHAGGLTSKDAYERLITLMDTIGMGALVNLNGGTGATLDRTLTAGEPYTDRVATFITFSAQGINEAGWSQRFAAEMERAFKAGALGMKVSKALGQEARNPDGSFIQADDPRLDPVWEMAAKYNRPVMIHLSDSIGRFYPIGPKNERYEAGLWRRPGDTEGNLSASGPKPEVIEKARENMHRKHPRTRFVNAHMAMLYYDPEKVARLLDTYPNADVEISATLQDLGRAPRLWREFIIKYQDRVLLGSDGNPNRQRDEFWTPHWRFLETYDEYFYHPAQIRTEGGSPGHGRWNISGIGLPDAVLRKVYYENALRHLPALRDSIRKQLAARR